MEGLGLCAPFCYGPHLLLFQFLPAPIVGSMELYDCFFCLFCQENKHHPGYRLIAFLGNYTHHSVYMKESTNQENKSRERLTVHSPN